MTYVHKQGCISDFAQGGGGKIAVSAYQGGQVLHAVHYNIIVKFQGGGGGQTSSKGPPKKNPDKEMFST